MKKIKLLLTIPALTIVAPSILTLTQCNKPEVFNGILVNLTKDEFEKNEKFKTNHIKVYKANGTTKGSEILWTDADLKIKDKNGQDITTTFKESGFSSSTSGTFTFTVVYQNYTKSFSINVGTFYSVNFNIGESKIVSQPTAKRVIEGSTWKDVKPTLSAKTDVDLTLFNVKWLNGSSTGAELVDTDPITSNLTAYLKIEFKEDTTKQATMDCNTYMTSLGGKTYAPKVLVDPTINPLISDTTYEYEFTINTANCQKIKWFWIVNTTQRGLMTIYPENIIEITMDTGTPAPLEGWTVEPWSTGSYITLNQASSFSTGIITIKLRMLKANLKLIPNYQIEE